MIQCASQCALEKNLSALIRAHVIPIAWKAVLAVSTRCAIRLVFFQNQLNFSRIFLFFELKCDGDIDENEDFHRCEDSLATELAQCLASCGGSSSCIIGCSTNYENGFKNCPCMEGCPKGCPCPEWDCSYIPFYMLWLNKLDYLITVTFQARPDRRTRTGSSTSPPIYGWKFC